MEPEELRFRLRLRAAQAARTASARDSRRRAGSASAARRASDATCLMRRAGRRCAAALRARRLPRGAPRARAALRQRGVGLSAQRHATCRRSAAADPARFPGAARRRGRAGRARSSRAATTCSAIAALQLGKPPDWHADVVHGRRAPRRLLGRRAVSSIRPPAITRSSGSSTGISTGWPRACATRSPAIARYYDAFVAQLARLARGQSAARRHELGEHARARVPRACPGSGRSSSSPAPQASDDRRARGSSTCCSRSTASSRTSSRTCRTTSARTRISRAKRSRSTSPGCALPELRPARAAPRSAATSSRRKPTRQMRADGGHAELSAHYHRYSTDFYLLARMVARRAGDRGRRDLRARRRARRRATCARSATTPGSRPQLGDDDGGQLFPICGAAAEDCRRYARAPRRSLLNEPALAVGPAPEESLLDLRRATPPRRCRRDAAHWPSTALDRQRLLRVAHHARRSSRLRRRPARVPQRRPCPRRRAVAHADRRRPAAADRSGHGHLHDGPRAARSLPQLAMHNTRGARRPVAVASPRGRVPLAVAGTDARRADLALEHGLRLRRRHARRLCARPPHARRPRGARHRLVDSRPRPRRGGTIAVEHFWHLHPSWTVSPASDARLPSDVGRRRAGARQHGAARRCSRRARTPLAVRSPAYGARRARRRPASRSTMATSRHDGRDVHSRRPPSSPGTWRSKTVRLAIAPGPGWHGCGFRVRWDGGAMVLLAAVEAGGVAAPGHRGAVAALGHGRAADRRARRRRHRPAGRPFGSHPRQRRRRSSAPRARPRVAVAPRSAAAARGERSGPDHA